MNIIEEFLDSISSEKNSALNTQEAYRNDLTEFILQLGKDVELISETDIKLYLKALAKRDFATNTISRKISSLRGFFSFLYIEKIRTDNPMLNIATPKKVQSLPKTLTHQEVQKILEFTANGKDFQALQLNIMIQMLYATGMRVSELVNLSINHIPIDQHYKFKENYFISKGKGSKERVIFLSAKCQDTLTHYIKIRAQIFEKSNRWLFPYGKKQGPINRNIFYTKLTEIARLCGINRINVSAHIFRHSFATHMLEGGADLRVIQELLGHSNINTTQIYTSISDDKMRNIIENYHPLSEKK